MNMTRVQELEMRRFTNQMWLVLTEESSGVGARSYRPDFHLGMRKQQPE